MVAWQRFNGKGKGKSKGKGKVKGKGKGKNKGNNLSLEERKKRFAELKIRTSCQACGARCPKNAKNEGTLQSPARVYLTIGVETSGFDLALTGDEMSLDATALVAHARLDARDIPVETPPKTPPGTRRPACYPLTASTDTSVRWRMQRLQSSRYERNG